MVLKLIPNCGNPDTDTLGVIEGVGVFVGVSLGVVVLVGDNVGDLVVLVVRVGVYVLFGVGDGLVTLEVSVGVGVGCTPHPLNPAACG